VLKLRFAFLKAYGNSRLTR